MISKLRPPKKNFSNENSIFQPHGSLLSLVINHFGLRQYLSAVQVVGYEVGRREREREKENRQVKERSEVLDIS